jgi:hypothetical protein
MTIPLVRTREASIWKLCAAEVRLSGQHRPDAAQIRKEFQQNFGKQMTTVRMVPRFYQARRSVEPTAYK